MPVLSAPETTSQGDPLGSAGQASLTSQNFQKESRIWWLCPSRACADGCPVCLPAHTTRKRMHADVK